MICFKCDNEIDTKDKIMVGVDKPYINIWFHKGCFIEIKPTLNEFLHENSDKLYNYTVKSENKKRK